MPFAVQLPDGSLDLDGTVAEPPGMFIDELRSDGQATERLNITVHAARDLAQALLEAADEIDRWATTCPTTSPGIGPSLRWRAEFM